MPVIEIATKRAQVRQAVAGGDGEVPLVDRLALVLCDILDEPLVTLPSDGESYEPRTASWTPLQLRLDHFKPELAELAVTLLEEAGF